MLFFTLMAPLLVPMPLIGVLANVGQSGLSLSGKSTDAGLQPLNPLCRFKRIFSLHGLVELVKTLLKVAIVGWLLYHVYSDSFSIFLSLAGGDLRTTGPRS